MDFKKFRKNRGKMAEAVKRMKDKKPDYTDDRFWTMTADKQGNADAVIRFLPQQDPEKEPCVMKFTHFIKDNGKYFVEDCPITIGKPCPADEYAQPYWDMDTEQGKQLASKYSKTKNFICNIQVVNDLAKPENNGKVFLFKFGIKIFEKIMGKIAPESELDEPVMVFDLWEGRNFKLKRRKVSGWINYDSSEFFDSNTPVAKSDDGIEKVYNQIRSLDEFVDPKLFKPYGDLKKKFITVVGDKAAKFFATSDSPDTGTEMAVQDAPGDADEVAFDDPVDDTPAAEGDGGGDDTAAEQAKTDEPANEKSDDDPFDDDDFNFDLNDDDFNFDDDKGDDDVPF